MRRGREWKQGIREVKQHDKRWDRLYKPTRADRKLARKYMNENPGISVEWWIRKQHPSSTRVMKRRVVDAVKMLGGNPNPTKKKDNDEN